MEPAFPWPLLRVREDAPRAQVFWAFGEHKALEVAADLLFAEVPDLRLRPDGESIRVTTAASGSRSVLIST